MGYETTIFNPEVVVLIVILSVFTILLPQRWALFPLLLVACFIPITQRLGIGGWNLHAIRMLFLAAWIRLIFRGEITSFKLNRIDKTLFLWIGYSSIIYLSLHFTSLSGALVNRLAEIYDVVGSYLVFRLLLRDKADLYRIVGGLSLMVLGVALFMVNEQMSGVNIFAQYSGGATHDVVGFEVMPEQSVIRGDRLRSQAAFLHPILAGTFGASLFPLFVSLFRIRANRLLCLLGILGSFVVVITSSSSGPLLTLIASICALAAWRYRSHMKAIQWAVFLSILGLHIVMKDPVWALVGRASLLTGSTGYHRYILIDNAITKFPEWWLLGIKSTASWGFFQFDVTNQYIAVGVLHGGVLSLILFLALLVYCFKEIGRTVDRLQGDSEAARFIWGLGCCLFAHAIAFLGVSYFGSMYVFLYLTIAMIGSLSSCFAGTIPRVELKEVPVTLAETMILSNSVTASNAESL